MAATWLLNAIYASLLGKGPPLDGSAPSAILANTTYGTVQGFSDVSSGVFLAKFYGIPYAKAPLGPFRFKHPVEPTPWSGVRNATEFGASCLQKYTPIEMLQDTGPTSEDCLFLNVYVPVERLQSHLPVMVWIHGGGYTVGSGSQYDATKLATKDVVMVTINYRLDAMGFLSTGDDAAPGNYGMLDQIMALKWVQKNIQSFGGDPNKVTIFGESAGSSSVSLLTISPLAKGLFENAIMESGSSLCPWAIQHPALRSNARSVSRLIASQVGCDSWSGNAAMVDCLRKVDAELLMNTTYSVTKALDSGIIMSPRVETTYGFLPDLPIHLLQQGRVNQVNTIRGYNSDEMAAYVDMLTNFMNDSSKVITKDHFKRVVEDVTRMFAIVDLDDMVTMMVNAYVGTVFDSKEMLQQSIDVADDLNFGTAAIIEQDLFAKAAPSYNHYVYEFRKRSSIYEKYPDWLGAFHGEDVAFVFGFIEDKPAYQAVTALMMDLWTSFAKARRPTSMYFSRGMMWPKFSESNPAYLLIDDTTRVLQYNNPTKLAIYRELLKRIDTVRLPSSNLIG